MCNAIHISRLKKVTGKNIQTSNVLLHLDYEEHVILIPKHMLATREKRLRNTVLKDLPVEDASGKILKFHNIQH